ncbi:MAG: DUF4405 domain-containing protein [Pirellulaceae bacterium]
MKLLLDWLQDRTGYQDLLREALYEPIPGGARWRYVWGSTLVFTFVIQLISGIFLWMAYSPSAQTAWESVYFIQNEMPYGSVVRGLHHYSAQMMVVLLAIHLIQVIIDGAYKPPRNQLLARFGPDANCFGTLVDRVSVALGSKRLLRHASDY